MIFKFTPRVKDIIKYENNLNIEDEKRKEISQIIDNFLYFKYIRKKLLFKFNEFFN